MNLKDSCYFEELTEIMEQIRKQADYPYLREHVDIPRCSVIRLHLLYLFLRECDLPIERIKTYCVTTALVQMGLDSHEQIHKAEHSGDEKRTRQLTVLAGDYFSSRYYYLLAEIGDMDVVQNLAVHIQKVNEKKALLYQKRAQGKLNHVEYLEIMNQIDSLLYTSFIDLYGEKCKWTVPWKLLVREMALVERLFIEFQRLPFASEDEKKPMFQYTFVSDKISRALDSCQTIVQALKNRRTRDDLVGLVQFFIRQMTRKSHQLLEEL